MARQIYSFTKIEKKRTNMGLVSLVLGILSILMLLGLIIASVVMGGELPFWCAGAGLLSLIMAAVGWILVGDARRDDDALGPFMSAGHRICCGAVVFYILVFLLGLMTIIM